jgi:amidase
VVLVPGCDSIIGSLGPLTRSLRDLRLFVEAYSSVSPWHGDPTLIPFPISISPKLSSPRLRVGILEDDGVATPLPPVRVVMTKMREKLAKVPSIELVPFQPFQHDRAWTIITSLYFEDGGKRILELFRQTGEPVLPLTDFILKAAQDSEAKSPPSLAARRALRDEFRLAYNEHWNSHNVDVVLAPVTPGTAPPLGTSRYWGYTAIWNLLDCPAVSFPAAALVGGLTKDELSVESYVASNAVEEGLAAHYCVENAVDQPLGLQIVGKPKMDGDVIAALSIIEAAIVGS